METTKQKVIFFVDDEPQVRKAVAQSLAQLKNCKVKCFKDAPGCFKEVRHNDCDLVIVDVNMPGMNGLELLKQIKTFRPQLNVLMVTGYGDIPMAVKAIKEGATDFVEKPLDEATFLPVVKNALQEGPSEPNPDIKMLTKTEIVILRQIGEGKTNKEIAQTLQRSVRTIENHRHRLMHKLKARNAVELLKKAIQMGLATSQ